MKNIRLFAIFCLIVAASACNKTEIDEAIAAYGSLDMSMSISQQTKALSDDDLYNSAVVNIYKADKTGLVRSYPYTDMPSPFYLAVGQYRVDVIAGECMSATPAVASWENKSYKGSETFTIVENQTQSVQVTAYVNNAVTNITLDQSVADNFNEGYTLTIGLDEADASTQLVYTADKSGSDGYFIINGLVLPSFKWTFSGTLAKDGSSFTKSGIIENIQAGKNYKMNLKYTIKDGDVDFTLVVDYTTDNYDDIIIFEPVSTGLAASSPFEIWAAHATLHADVDAETAEGATIKFAYSSDNSVWTEVDAVADPDSENAYKADITGLTANTEYTYKLLINGEQVGDPLTFTTEDDSNLPNSQFNYYSKVGSKDFYKFYDPNCGVAEGMTMFWGSGNGLYPESSLETDKGSASMDIIITTIDTGRDGTGSSVLAQTSAMAGILAAGNLFTGRFNGLVGTSGGRVNFGRPWTTRPTAIEVYCKYTTGMMTTGDPTKVGLDDSAYDRAQMKIAIGTWDYKTYGGTAESPVHVNTTDESTFVNYYTDNSTIAAGDLIIFHDGYAINKGNEPINSNYEVDGKVTATTSEWVKYTVPLIYKDLNQYPTHIVVSFAASQFGDYFTGYNGAKLWIDDVRLIYE